MKKIVYSPDYVEKVIELKKYLEMQFDKETSNKILKELDRKIHLLKSQEKMGLSVQSNFGVDCDYLCVYAAKNYVFYRINDDTIYIINMYNERENFMQKMFGKKDIKDLR